MAKLMRLVGSSLTVSVPKAPARGLRLDPGSVVDFDEVLFTQGGGVPYTLAQAVAGREELFTPADHPAFDGLPVESEEE